MTHEQHGSFWMPTFRRWLSGSSVVAHNSLFLDAGMLAYYNPQYKHEIPTRLSASTIIIPLDKPWTNASVADHIMAIDKPKGFPFSRMPYIWYNPYSRAIQSVGGDSFIYKYFTEGWSVEHQHEINNPKTSPANSLWQLTLPGPYGLVDSPWMQLNKSLFTLPKNSPSGLSRAAGVLTPHSFYVLGGADDNDNGIRGLFQYSFQSEKIHNTSSTGFGPNGYAAWNQGIHSPLFGYNGVLIYIGGYAPHSNTIPHDSPGWLQDMTAITIYDIASGTFHTQTATLHPGTSKPSKRWGFCAVAASEKGSGTVDIFMHGGWYAEENNAQYDPSYAKVYVLSIPSFVWTEIPNSLATQRGLHTCQIIGNRQMAILGGDTNTGTAVGATVDPWTNGIGIFDVSAWKWSSRFDPSASAYKRAPQLVQMSRKQFTAKRWDSKFTEGLFDMKPPPSSKSQDTSSDAGAIAGGVVGALVILALIAGGIFLYWRRRRKTQLHEEAKLATIRTTSDSASARTPSTAELSSTEPSSAHPTDILSPTTLAELPRNSLPAYPQELPRNSIQPELESPTETREKNRDTIATTPPLSPNTIASIEPSSPFPTDTKEPPPPEHSAELLGDTRQPRELEAPNQVHEIGSSHVPGSSFREES